MVHTVIAHRFAFFSYSSEPSARPPQRQSLFLRRVIENDWPTTFPMRLVRCIRRREAKNSLLRSDKTICRSIVCVSKVEIAKHGTRIPSFRALPDRIWDRRIHCGANRRYLSIRQWQHTDQLVYVAGLLGWKILGTVETCTPIAGSGRSRRDAGTQYII